MAKLTVFVFTSLDGYYKGLNEDISWDHSPDKDTADETAFGEEMLGAGSILLFGRVTYELMASYWPSTAAQQSEPAIAEGMNKAEKIVFSKTLKKSEWNNTRIVRDSMEEEIKKLKASGKNLTILGSGNIVSQLAQQGLIDEYQIKVDPVALGAGASLFKGISRRLNLKLTKTKVFKSGSVLLFYAPA